MLRQGELEDLQRIAEAWGIPPGTVLWFVVHEWLAQLRGRQADFGPYGLEIAAGLDLLGYTQGVMRAARELVEQRERAA